MLQTIEDTAPEKRSVLHYAFLICLGGFLTQFIVLSAQRLPAISLESIRQALGASYSEIGLITSVYMIFYAGLLMAILPKIVSRWFAPHKRGVARKQMQQAE